MFLKNNTDLPYKNKSLHVYTKTYFCLKNLYFGFCQANVHNLRYPK